MAGFFVRPDSVTAYGTLVQAHGGYLDRANSYGAQEAHVDDSSVGSLFKLVFGMHYEAHGMVCDYLAKLGYSCRDSGGGLLRAADLYRSSDMSAAAELDRTYPGEDLRPVLMGPPASGIQEYSGPLGRLVQPAEPPDFEDPGGIVDTISDLLSPAKWIQEVIDACLGVNPLEKAVEPYLGDWKAIAKASGAFHCLSYFCADASRTR